MRENFFFRVAQGINILNADDFNRQSLEIESFKKFPMGIADKDEVILRNEIVSILFHNADLRKIICGLSDDYENKLKLPENGNKFLNFYQEGKENAYWETVDQFIALTEKEANKSVRLNQLLNRLREDRQKFIAEETAFGQNISAKLKAVTRMEGILTIKLHDSKVLDSTIVGQKKFSAKWSPDYQAEIPRWLKNKFFAFLGIKKFAQNIAKKIAWKKSLKASMISDIPGEVVADIAKGLDRLIYDDQYFTIRFKMPNEKSISKDEKNYYQIREDSEDMIFTIQFIFDNKEMKIKIIGVEEEFREYCCYEPELKDVEWHAYRGIEEKQKKLIKERLGLFETLLERTISLHVGLQKWEKLSRNSKLDLNKWFQIESAFTDKLYAWNFLDNLYCLEENQRIFQALTKQRKFFSDCLEELSDIAKIIDEMEALAIDKAIPICLPIIKAEPGILFKNMAPINMISQKEKMIPFSLEEINGRIIGLTGKHGRGKSVAGNSILENIWLAQSGFPVFAESLFFNIKDNIGAVTNDVGDGSTATVFVKKVKNLLENIAKVPAEKSLIFIDEIGKGTQEAAGLELGKRILNTLADGKYSVIFSTQIIALSEYAQQHLGAKCFKVNDDHQFTPGIGSGDMEDLIKEVGLDAYLKK